MPSPVYMAERHIRHGLNEQCFVNQAFFSRRFRLYRSGHAFFVCVGLPLISWRRKTRQPLSATPSVLRRFHLRCPPLHGVSSAPCRAVTPYQCVEIASDMPEHLTIIKAGSCFSQTAEGRRHAFCTVHLTWRFGQRTNNPPAADG